MQRQTAEFRRLPSVDALLRVPTIDALRSLLGPAALAGVVREVLQEARGAVAAGSPAPSQQALAEEIAGRMRLLADGPLVPVINASGVVIHTNLGRAPLAEDAARAALQIAQGYSNLEYDLDAGGRGSRDRHVERLLCQVTGAEAALAVNNNASALLLALSAVGAGREGIISRGQAVEIGGGFRIPDVMRQSGVRLVEVGTTNRTYLRDYESALTDDTAVLLKVHSSNFAIVGFTHEVGIADLVGLADSHGVCAMDDQGSGCLIDTRQFGLTGEPLVQDSVAAGAGLVCFSGDKLLGGPQAGLIVGRRDWIDRLRRHPLARAVRIDKVTLAALLATLRHYLRGDTDTTIPVWQMIAASAESLRARAAGLAAAIDGELLEGRSAIGGGSLPGQTLPTTLVALPAAAPPDIIAARLRRGRQPVVARVENDRVVIDLRTVLPGEDEALLTTIRQALAL